MSKEFNRVYMFGAICVQTLLMRGYECIHLLPQLSLAINSYRMYFAVGFEWIVGTINIGWAKPSFVEQEKYRKEELQKRADEKGITQKEMELRYNP